MWAVKAFHSQFSTEYNSSPSWQEYPAPNREAFKLLKNFSAQISPDLLNFLSAFSLRVLPAGRLRRANQCKGDMTRVFFRPRSEKALRSGFMRAPIAFGYSQGQWHGVLLSRHLNQAWDLKIRVRVKEPGGVSNQRGQVIHLKKMSSFRG